MEKSVKQILHYREPDEHCAVPKGVRDDDGAESLREESIGESPDDACNSGRHYEHEVHLRDVYQAVDQCGYDEADSWGPSL